MRSCIKIGTRGSKLALWQAQWVKEGLEKKHPGLTVDLEIIKTRGDKILDVPLAKVGGKGLFVKEIEEALMAGQVDLAVHSMKDMPADIPEGLCIGAIPPRENPKDVLIARHHKAFADLPEKAVIGTSSLRRAAQLLHARKDLVIQSLRGNLDTRLSKLETEGLDAIVLAAAGVLRLGLKDRITEYFDPTVMLPAIGQGALCIEIRENDETMQSMLETLGDPDTWKIVMGERAFLNRLGGGCQVPIAGVGHIQEGKFFLTGLVASPDGTLIYKDKISGPSGDSEKLGRTLADRLADRGAGKIISNLKEEQMKNEIR
ncbi:MAG: hydroxymethylbilane synthase [Desulfobacteraceae bacterium]|nr:hydroxymethylbilane synthase [Desulfobacteraceae bacterium]MBU4055397.1 hydroxymethylbilane synthase [Pseudomonadota bacterium]